MIKKPLIAIDSADLIRQWLVQLPTLAGVIYAASEDLNLPEAVDIAWNLLLFCRDRLEKEKPVNVTQHHGVE